MWSLWKQSLTLSVKLPPLQDQERDYRTMERKNAMYIFHQFACVYHSGLYMYILLVLSSFLLILMLCSVSQTVGLH